MTMTHKFALKALTAACLLASQTTFAQSSLALEEVVVTAQKRAQSIKDVSISVAVMGGDDISDKAMIGLEQVTANLPAVTVAQNILSQFIFMRGIGTPGIAPGSEQSVGMFSDGIYLGRPTMARAPLMDIDRVEIMRGPQSIFFGKNTMAGAIGTYTASPTQEFEGKVSALYEPGDNEKELNLMLSGPLSDTVSGRLAVRKYDMDGYIENKFSEDEGPKQDDTTVRVKLAWDATDTISIEGSYEYNEFRSDGALTEVGSIENWTPAPDAAIQQNYALGRGLLALSSQLTGGLANVEDGVTALNNTYESQQVQALNAAMGLGLDEQMATLPSGSIYTESDSDLFILKAEQELGAHTFTGIYGYANFETSANCNCDNSPVPLVTAKPKEDYSQHSIELRLTSTDPDTLEYMGGLFYQTADLDFYESNDIGLSLVDLLTVMNGGTAQGLINISRDMRLKQETDTWSVFGSTTWHITNQFRNLLGLRYQQETKDATHVTQNYITGMTPTQYDAIGSPADALYVGMLDSYEHSYNDEIDDTTISWLLKFEYDITPDAMIYASVSNGAKAGGFDARNVGRNDAAGLDQWSFEEEEAISYELGIKQSLMGGRMQLYAALYHTTVEDYQVSVYLPPINFYVDNAAELTSRGLELETQFRATEELTISLAVAYLDSSWDSFKDAPCTEEQKVTGACARGSQDLSGEVNVFSPEWSGNLTLTHSTQLGEFYLDSTLDVNYSDSYYTESDLDENTKYDAWTTVDLRIALSNDDNNWQLALAGKNLSDEEKGNSRTDLAFMQGAYFTQIDRMRSIALQASYNF